MDIQWYPGHMAKTRRELKELLPLLSVIVEVADARLPKSSRNPELKELVKKLPRILLLNKSDLGETQKINAWLDYYQRCQEVVLPFNARTGKGLKQLQQVFLRIADEQIKTGKGRRSLRIGVVGIPNVGKSAVLNRLVGRNAAQVGNKPGVTRGRQWVKKERWEVLDTPGLLWPKIEDPEAGWYLAFLGSIKSEIIDVHELAVRLIAMLTKRFPLRIKEYYGTDEDGDQLEVLEEIGKKRGCLMKGGRVDLLRAANLLWTDFKTGNLGGFTLEDPPSFPSFEREDAGRRCLQSPCSSDN